MNSADQADAAHAELLSGGLAGTPGRDADAATNTDAGAAAPPSRRRRLDIAPTPTGTPVAGRPGVSRAPSSRAELLAALRSASDGQAAHLVGAASSGALSATDAALGGTAHGALYRAATGRNPAASCGRDHFAGIRRGSKRIGSPMPAPAAYRRRREYDGVAELGSGGDGTDHGTLEPTPGMQGHAIAANSGPALAHAVVAAAAGGCDAALADADGRNSDAAATGSHSDVCIVPAYVAAASRPARRRITGKQRPPSAAWDPPSGVASSGSRVATSPAWSGTAPVGRPPD
jgi:hypothetical protein